MEEQALEKVTVEGMIEVTTTTTCRDANDVISSTTSVEYEVTREYIHNKSLSDLRKMMKHKLTRESRELVKERIEFLAIYESDEEIPDSFDMNILNDSIGPPEVKRKKCAEEVFNEKLNVKILLSNGMMVNGCTKGQGENDKEVWVYFQEKEGEKPKRKSVALSSLAQTNPEIEALQRFYPESQEITLDSQDSINDFFQKLANPPAPTPHVSTSHEESTTSKPRVSSQDQDFMDVAFFDSTITGEMEEDAKLLMENVSEMEKEEKGDVYIICDGDRIIYIGRSLELALRFYYHLYQKNKAIYLYKQSHPGCNLTALPLFPNGTSPVKTYIFEGLIIYLAEELELQLRATVDGEEMLLNDSIRNKKKERIPKKLMDQLENPGERAKILNGLKCMIRKAVNDGHRISEYEADEYFKTQKRPKDQKRRLNVEVKKSENIKNKSYIQQKREEGYGETERQKRLSNYHERPSEDDILSRAEVIAAEVVERPENVRELLLGLTEEEFNGYVRGPYSAHRMAARFGLIENTRNCATCGRAMSFVKHSSDCGHKWECKFYDKEIKDTVTHSSVPCCRDSILQIKSAGGLCKILRMLYKIAHGTPRAQIVAELGPLRYETAAFKDMHKILGID